jgi:hypothetical protein
MIFMITEYLKDLKFINIIPTKYLSSLIALILLITVSFQSGNFTLWNIPLFLLNAIMISLTANGLSNFNKTMVRK